MRALVSLLAAALGVSAAFAHTGEVDVLALIRERLAAGAKDITIPKGRYRLEPKGEVYLSLQGLRDVTIDFGGSEFVGTVKTQMIGMRGCTNVTLRNLFIDYDSLPFTQGVITRVDKDRNWDVKIVPGYPRPEGPEVGLDTVAKVWPVQVYDRKTLELKNPMRFQKETKIEKTGPDTYHVSGGIDRRGDVGDVCVWSIREHHHPYRRQTVTSIWCEGCRFEDIVCYATPYGSCAFSEIHATSNVYRRCAIRRRAPEDDPVKRGMKRLRSGNHDAFNSRRSHVGPVLENCTFRHHCDDCVNISGYYGIIAEGKGRTWRVLAGEAPVAPGDTAQVMSYAGRCPPDVTVVAVRKVGGIRPDEAKFLSNYGFCNGIENTVANAYEVTVDRDEDLPFGSVIASNRQLGNGFAIRGCDFGSCRARGMLIKASDGLMESNVVSGCFGPAVVSTPEYQWIEAGCSANLLIRDNDFRDNLDSGVWIGGYAGNGKQLSWSAHRDIRIVDNRVSGSPKGIVLENCTGYEVRGNEVSVLSGEERPRIILHNVRRSETDFDEPGRPDVTRVWRTEKGVRELPVEGPYFTGSMITSPDDCGDGRARTFLLRRTFRTKAKPSVAWLQGYADRVGSFRLNGAEVAKSAFDETFPSRNRSFDCSVTDVLKAGTNEFAIRLETKGNRAGGALAELFVGYPDGTFERIVTDGSFRAVAEGSSAWKDVVLSAPPPAAPWPYRFVYRDHAREQKADGISATPARVTAGERTTVRLGFTGEPPEGRFPAVVRLCREGRMWWQEDVVLDAGESVERTAPGAWSLRFDYETPRYLHEGDYELSVASGAFPARTPGRCVLTLSRMKPEPPFDRPLVSEVKKCANGSPQVYVNGQVLPLLWGAVRQWRRPDGLPRHGFDPTMMTVYMGFDYRSWHTAPGVWDFSLFDRRAEQYRRENPNGYFLIDLTVCPPSGWGEAHPDEMCRNERGEIANDGGRTNYAFPSKAAIEEMRESLRRAIAWCEGSPYANRIIGYRVNSGHTIEWLHWEGIPGQPGDFSEITRRAFAAWAKERYPTLADPHAPTAAEQRALDDGARVWDPAKHLNAIAYTEFLSEAVADDILALCGYAKELLKGRKVVGTYYGYTATLNCNGESQRRGHFALKRLLDDAGGKVDFLMSPQAYEPRDFGGICGDMKPFATLRERGILSALENDARTHCTTWGVDFGYCQTPTPWHSLQVLKRDFGTALCRDQPVFSYALESGTELDYPEARPAMARLLALTRHRLSRGPKPRKAEVAVVVSERAVCREPIGGPRSAIDVYARNYELYQRAGAAVDYVLAEDLANAADGYRLYIFENALVWDDAFRRAVEDLQRRNVTLMWLSAPGYGKGLVNSTANMRTLTGFALDLAPRNTAASATMADGRTMGLPDVKAAPLFAAKDADEVLGTWSDGSAAVAVKRTGAATGVFVGPWRLDLAFVRDLYRRAGVREWTDSDDPVDVCGDLVMLHARRGGTKRISLPVRTDVLDVFAGKVVARNAAEFSFDSKLHESHLFYFGDDAEDLMKGMKE